MEKERITIEYCDDGIHASDQGAWEWLYQIQNDILKNGVQKRHWKVSNELMVELSRLLVTRKIIEPDQIVYEYKGLHIAIGRDGGLREWPKGFCDNKEMILDELIDFRSKLKKRVESGNNTTICRQCKKPFDPKETERAFGMIPLTVGCCCSICYTKFKTSEDTDGE